MELRPLRSFVRVVEHESFTAAARSLEVTQAAISQQIAGLERELGVRLLDRGGRRVTLTPAGRTLYEHALRILDQVDRAVLEVGGGASQMAASLRIASSTVPAEWLLPEVLTALRRRFPHVSEMVSVTDSDLAIQAVRDGTADVGFVGRLPEGEDLESRVVAQDEMLLIVPAGHALARQKSARLESLRSEPLVLREPGSGCRSCVEDSLKEHGWSLGDMTVALEVNSNEAIRRAVQQGLGIAFLSERAAGSKREWEGVAEVRLRGVRPRRDLYCIYRLEEPLAPALAALLEVLEAEGH